MLDLLASCRAMRVWAMLLALPRTPVLLGLLFAVLSVWFCFDSGAITRTDRVTVTSVLDRQVYVPASSGGTRISGMPARWQRDYQVHCMTVRGMPCMVDTEEYAIYREGELITAEVSLVKPAGEFGWTRLGKRFAWAALMAWAVAWLGWRLVRRD